MERGYDVTVLTRKEYLNPYKGVKFIKLPYINDEKFETMSHSILCVLYCLFNKPNVVHVHNMGACLLLPLLRLRGIKVVLTIHSLNYTHKKWGKFAQFILHTCERIGVKSSNVVITVSKGLRSHLSHQYGNTKIRFIPNGVAEPEFEPANIMMLKYNLEPKKYILAVGRLSPEKGFDRLIKAYNKLKDPKFKLVIAGDNEYPTRYRNNLLKKRSNNIEFTRYICSRELAELYCNAGLFVSSSINEGFPLVLLEALSYGLPVLVSDIPAHKEMLLPPYRYFNWSDNLGAKICYLLEKGIATHEAQKYDKLLKERYNWEAITKETSNMYG